MPEILILSGPPAAGKSTVAQALADRYDRVAHIDVDVLRHFVTPTGFAKPGQPERHHQRLLGVRNACALARNFLDERFGVIIDECFDEPGLLPLYLAQLADASSPIHLVQLFPTLDACEARDKERRRARGAAPFIRSDYARYAALAPTLPGALIDSSDLTPYATADKVQALTTSGESLIQTPAGA
ncbi:MAG: AAA family ATPase [Dehalococcoidia bacterium]|nr:AAA family ATPase [Dehalococcoidia bacterium]